MKSAIVTIDGSKGEGGGQMLRSALTLSMMTGQPFKMVKIRAKRDKPGLLRQHLTAVQAAAKICGAKVTGAELGAQEILFIPDALQPGNYHFAIGSAGSTTLVAQTVLPALMLLDKPSTIEIEGGTHNLNAPPFDFLENSFLPILQKMGVHVKADLHQYGFYPAGGGKISLQIKPTPALKPIELMEPGNDTTYTAKACFANLSARIAQRELNVIEHLMQWPKDRLQMMQIKNASSAGNFVVLNLAHENVTETIVSFGQWGVKAEEVAKSACQLAKEYLSSPAAVGVHLADQLLLPMVLAQKGKFTTCKLSQHAQTNIEVIKAFIDCEIMVAETAKNLYTVSIHC